MLAATLGTAEQKAHLNTLMQEMAKLEKAFDRDRWIDIDTSWHEHIYEMCANPFLTSFSKLFHSVYHIYFTSITEDEVIELASHQAIVDAIQAGDGQQALIACQALLNAPHIRALV
jgi:DNA-binding FadR family transcriptional regulator